MKGFDFMIIKAYEGNKNLKGLTKVTEALKTKIRHMANRSDEKTATFISGKHNGDLYLDFFYLKHDIFARIRDGMVTVYEFDYCGNYFWSCESREIGTFEL